MIGKFLANKSYLTLLVVFALLVLSIGAYASRLPTNAGDSGTWGTTLNDYLTTLAGANATDLNQTKIGANNINASAVNTTHILDGTILAGDLAPSSVNTTHIVDATIAAADLASSSVNSTHIVDGTILTGDISDATIAAADLAPSSVNTTHIVANTILAADIAADNIDGTELADAITLDANLSINGTTLFVDISNGRVGIGTNAPTRNLEVSTTFKIVPQTSPPSSPAAAMGDIYVDTSGAFCFYNGSSWVNLSVGACS